MGWSIGYDDNWNRDIGYGVPAYCDHPGCKAEIDRGLGYVCGGEPFGGEHGCGLFVCGAHQHANSKCFQLCLHCADRRRKKLTPSPDHPEWIQHQLTDASWAPWREQNPELVAKMRASLDASSAQGDKP